MNPKNLNVYLQGLGASMAEKMTFCVNVFKRLNSPIDPNNKVIIDFGCGDGSLLDMMIHGWDTENTLFIGVEQNELLREIARVKLGAPYVASPTDLSRMSLAYKGLSSLEELEDFLKSNPTLLIGREVVILCSSVLHELENYQKNLVKFIKKYVDYVVIRDMCPTIETPFSSKQIAKIIRGSDPKRLSEFIEKYGMSDVQVLHYLLKYTYVDNWKSELLEDYTSVNWKLYEKLGPVLWDHVYLQEWRKDKVKEDFGFNLDINGATTHREVVIRVEK